MIVELSPAFNGAIVPIATPSGLILGHLRALVTISTPSGFVFVYLNTDDRLVHGIDGNSIGIWQPSLTPITIDGITSQSPTVNNSQTFFAQSSIAGNLTGDLNPPPIREATQPSTVPSAEGFEPDSSVWTHVQSSPYISTNNEPGIGPTPPNTSRVSRTRLPNRSDSMSDSTWVNDSDADDLSVDFDIATDSGFWQSASPEPTHAHEQLHRDPALSTPDTISTVGSTTNLPTQVQGLAGFQCSICIRSFKRYGDRVRHERSVHRAKDGLFVCPISGCPNSQGAGYSRLDKVREHLWKQHGDLGYAKRIS